MNQPPFFPAQFMAKAPDGSQFAAAGYRLHTFVSGTTDPATTFRDEDGTIPHQNPILLDDNGTVPDGLWLDDIEYTLRLEDALGAFVQQWDGVAPCARTTDVVTSVNGAKGAVTLTADTIDYENSSGFDWLDASNVGDALDQFADRLDDFPAASITVADAGDYFEAPKNVEEVLQQLGQRRLPDPDDKAGRALVVNTSEGLEWQIVRTFWSLAVNGGAGGTRTVRLPPGTYQVTLETHFGMSVEGVNVVIEQEASIGSVDLKTEVAMSKSGGNGGMFAIGSGLNSNTLIVSTEAEFTMEIEAMPVNVVGYGSRLTVERV